ncbi:MAG: hypothetical protein JNK76_12725 [Planctomycetales bacterium]|nr:hypothetical protein [Planctomycetales bacterium]
MWEQLRHAPIVRRLHLLSQLHIESGLAERDVKPVINRAIKVFSARNHIAHNPVTFGKDGQRISRLGAQADRNEMSADDIFRVAQEADNVYNDVVELHFRKVIVDFESAPPKEQ